MYKYIFCVIEHLRHTTLNKFNIFIYLKACLQASFKCVTVEASISVHVMDYFPKAQVFVGGREKEHKIIVN